MRSEIGVDHAAVALDLARRAGRQHLAVRQAVDRRGHVHDHAHVVLDDEQRDAHFAVRPFETVEQAVVREVEEELGLQISVERKLADIWFRGNRQEYFLVKRISGEFGTGTGEEYESYSPENGTYLPMLMPIADVLNNPVVPVEMAEMVVKSVNEGWPPKPVIIFEEEK